MLNFLILVLALFLIHCGSAPSKPKTDSFAAWTELGPDSKLLVRVAMQAETCPQLLTSAGSVSMSERGTKTKAFPVLICEASLASSVTSIQVQGQNLAVLKPELKKILVIGDTGCRIKASKEHSMVQACNDPDAWPLAQVAAAASSWQPDLVIHVGDYHYRESACPPQDQGCTGATAGDLWPSWQEDFLLPAAALLRAAPWIMVRGNHESCSRGGVGWFQLLDARAWQECQEKTPPFSIELGDHQFLVIDSNLAENISPSLAQVAPAPAQFHWLLLHRPFLTPFENNDGAPKGLPKSLQKPGLINLILSGHFHVLNLNQVKGATADEFIVGNGGTRLDEEKRPSDLPQVKSEDYDSFGFLTLEKLKVGTWKVSIHDKKGSEIRQCTWTESMHKGSDLNCRP